MKTPSTDLLEPSRVLVVGTDGSPSSLTALDWAVHEAAEHGGQVKVVHAWHRTNAPSGAPSGHEDEAGWRVVLHTLREVPHAAVDVVAEVTQGPASTVLVDAAADADLLVVGALGVREGQRIVLGSVSARCALHATCPVVIVPAGWRPRVTAASAGRSRAQGRAR